MNVNQAEESVIAALAGAGRVCVVCHCPLLHEQTSTHAHTSPSVALPPLKSSYRALQVAAAALLVQWSLSL